jgi:hypothetical protein
MTLRLTPDLLAAAYEYLSLTDPFLDLNLPPAEEIIFRVIKTPRWHADCEKLKRPDGRKYLIRVSQGTNGHTGTLMATMAHEKIHVHQLDTGQSAAHNEMFDQIAARACAAHGFDPLTF